MGNFFKKNTSINDQIAYDEMREGNMIGWAMLYEKYFSHKYFLKHFPYAPNLTIDQRKDIWSMSLEKLFIQVRMGKFLQMQSSHDFLLPGIIGIAKMLCKKETSKSTDKMQLIPEKIAEGEDQHDDVRLDLLKVRIAMQSLDDVAIKILLLSYFPEQPHTKKQTDEDRANQLKSDSNESWDKNKYGVYRRRALQKLVKQYEKIDKDCMEQEVLKQDLLDYNFLNLSFPSNELYALLFNKNEAISTQQHNEQIKSYLEQNYKGQKIQQSDRLYVYASDVLQWQDRLIENQAKWTVVTIVNHLQGLIISLRNSLFPITHLKQQ